MKIINYANFNIYHFDEINSTNVKAYEMANLGNLKDHEIILSDKQNQGRGRLDRSWVSPTGNLYFSLLLKPKIAISKAHELSFLAIAALFLAIEEILPKNTKINLKWPNDLLLDEKKAAGILLESKINGADLDFVVIGIGVNILSNPQNVLFSATNLKEFGVEISNIELLKKFLEKFEDLYQNYLEFGFKKARNIWLRKAFRFKEEVTVNQNIKGIFENFDEEGNLILRVGSELRKITSGDVGI